MDEIQINSIVDINTNNLNPKRGNTQAELKKDVLLIIKKKMCGVLVCLWSISATIKNNYSTKSH